MGGCEGRDPANGQRPTAHGHGHDQKGILWPWGHQIFMYSKNLEENWPGASANHMYSNWLAQTGTQIQKSSQNPYGKLTEHRSEPYITKENRLAKIRPNA
jgi:hypothetical protein